MKNEKTLKTVTAEDLLQVVGGAGGEVEGPEEWDVNGEISKSEPIKSGYSGDGELVC